MRAPTLFKRASYTIVYNIIVAGIVFPLFFLNFTLDDVAWHLDNLTMTGLFALTPEFFACIFSFWLAFRQFFKEVNLFRFLFKSKDHIDSIEKRGAKTSYEGSEGTGKTLNVANDTLLLASEKDRKMRLEYIKKLPFRDKLIAEGDIDFKVLEESFLYYERNKNQIPHFMSNFTVVYDGKKNYPFSMEYLDQERRLAEGFALGLTEVANILPNAWSRIPGDESKDVHKLRIKSETLSLCRQFFDCSITYDEQRTGEIFLGLRALNAENRHLLRRESALDPKLLLLIRNRIENKKLIPIGEKVLKLRERLFDSTGTLVLLNNKLLKDYNKQLCKLEKNVKVFNFFDKLCKRIGFYLFYYELKDSQDGKKQSEELYFVTPKWFPFRFDTRGLRYNYKLFNEKPDTIKKDSL